ncbi:hypothetical protein FHR32_002128 [Streptosporangium album]|uniref:Uncharacterized protein n=1 Tax=Streptosporangium album TaxID=47479 RepID=A0A7W7RUK0_9ACTN|nr:hypothetical protein [Streptosporangium album]MBB4937823.1 hypothetical protein [Streptosporangium album]
METAETNTLKAPGATLYYEVRGSGPVLLPICGGIYDAAGYGGLELAARHPWQVRTLVAHEPPVLDLLPDRDHWHAVIRDVEEAFLKEGAGQAMQVFAAGSGMDGGEQEDGGEQAPQGQGEPDPEMTAMTARMGKNMEFFIGYEVPPFTRHTPDIAARLHEVMSGS